jgi:hypothetical protein
MAKIHHCRLVNLKYERDKILNICGDFFIGHRYSGDKMLLKYC